MVQKFNVTGMTCAACSSHVEKAVQKLQGVQKAEDLGQGKFRVHFTDAQETTDAIVKASTLNEWRLSEIRVEKSSLDNIFAELTKKAQK